MKILCRSIAMNRLHTLFAAQIRRGVISALAVLVTLVTLNATSIAQSATATLSGAVTDQTGAVVAQANVKAVNTATNVERKTTTNSEGFFTLPLLPPGNYTILCERDGFTAITKRDVILNVGDQRSLLIQLGVSGMTATVNVTDKASLANESSAVSTVVDRQFIENQPLNGRSFQALMELSPGVVLTVANVTSPGQFSVNGQRAGANYFTVDGVSANFGVSASSTLYETAGGGIPAYSAQGGVNSLASVDAVQEFAIQTSTYAPEFGRQPGAQVSVVTRSGTNELHGGVFNYFRNDALDANDYFAKANRLPKPRLRQNDFGFTLGGPVVLPGRFFGPLGYDGRNRTFIFASYEGLRLRQPIVSSPELVPSLAARAAGAGVIKDIFNAFPAPNGPTSSTDPNTATFIASYSNPSRLDAAAVRVDHKVGERLTLFGRYNHAPSENQARSAPGGSSVAVLSYRTQTLTTGGTMIFSPRLSNDLRFNYSRARARTENILENFGGAVAPPDAAFFPPFASPQTGLSLIGVSGNILRSGLSQENTQRQINVVDNVSLAAGAHALKFGVDYRRLAPIADQGEYTRFINFTNPAQALAGNAASVLIARADIDLFPIYNNFSAFAQDTWRATPRLTLIYGLRYDINPAPSDKNGNLPLTVKELDDPGNLSLASRGARLYKTSYDDFAPRIGLAYRLSQAAGLETTLRGGFGVFYDLGYTFTGSALAPSNYPYGNTVTLTNIALTNPFVSSPAPAPNPNPPYPALFAYEEDYKSPYTLQFNLAVEQSLSRGDAITVTYVGAVGRRLGRAEVILNPNASFTRLNVVRNAASSDYHALQAQYQRRLARGLQALASYTWSKSLDNVSEESTLNYQAPLSRYDARLDRGPSIFDARHQASGAISYDIPSPFGDRIGRALLGDFAVDAIFRARTATPTPVLTNTDSFGFGVTTVSRPNLVPGAPLYIDDPTVAGGRRFNRAAFALPPAGTQGNFGRNVLRGFPVSQFDVSLRRRFDLSERASLSLRVDAFNVFNHPIFANPEGRLNNPNFGVSTQMLGRSLASTAGLNSLYQIGGPRSLQLALKLNF
jgi:hypothetical protein